MTGERRDNTHKKCASADDEPRRLLTSYVYFYERSGPARIKWHKRSGSMEPTNDECEQEEAANAGAERETQTQSENTIKHLQRADERLSLNSAANVARRLQGTLQQPTSLKQRRFQ